MIEETQSNFLRRMISKKEQYIIKNNFSSF